MSEWLNASSSSNKLKQSYFQNFVDVSGTVSLRNNNNINLYNNDFTPEFSINSQEIRVRDNNVYYDISNSKFQYIKDLTENVHERLQDLISRTKHINDNSFNITFDSSIELRDKVIALSDLSLNGDINMNGDAVFEGTINMNGVVSMNESLFVNENIGIGISNPIVSLDVSSNNAIRIPRGTTDERPTTSGEATEGGYIRYNMTTHQFEGYGPGNSWGSLGGVINVAQNTKIITSTPNADSTNNELIFFTATAGSTIEGDAIERMVIKSTGDISMNHRLLVAGDVSMNSNLSIGGDASLNSELYVENATNLNSTLNVNKATTLSSTLVVTGKTTLSSDVSMNGNVDICGNLYAQYPISSIPPNAIQGVGTEEGNVMVSVYTSDEIKFDDDEFVIVKEDKDKIQITPYGIFVSENVIFEDDDFALFKENPIPKIEHNLHLKQSLSVSGETVFDNVIKVPTLPIDTNTNQAASCAYVQNQNYIISSTLMKQF